MNKKYITGLAAMLAVIALTFSVRAVVTNNDLKNSEETDGGEEEHRSKALLFSCVFIKKEQRGKAEGNTGKAAEEEGDPQRSDSSVCHGDHYSAFPCAI